jgi:hypothetical protein
MDQFLRGAVAMSCLAAGLFFLRFWTRSRDRLLLAFAVAFGLLAVNWIWLTVAYVSPASEPNYKVYFIRLAAFALIIVAIVDKNRRTR